EARVSALAEFAEVIADQRAQPSQQPAQDVAQQLPFDLAILVAPQSRALARRWMLEARTQLHEGGRLLLVGANEGGVRSLIDDAAALFGSAHTLLVKRRARVAQAVRTPAAPMPAWAEQPGIAPGTWHSFAAALPSGTHTLHSLPGVFSYERLDTGTALLLAHMGQVTGSRVLDLGCGYGVLGLAAALSGAAQVDMLDDDLYAVAAAARNVSELGLTQVRVMAAHGRTSEFRGPYDLVITNPPFHQGKATDFRAAQGFFSYARELLAAQGRLLLVANSFLRYADLLGEQFASVTPLIRTPSFTVWQAQAG
ncbi:MAG: class I SAM-dependent methyltransferase, partial [Roseiflexaceae bacterium]|nr:class I SAM-dependent methyltransferase [Roseiflexaceae bacterium]